MLKLKWLSFLALAAWGVLVVSSARASDIPLGRNEVELSSTLGETQLAWAPAYCRPNMLRFRALGRAISLVQVRVVYTSTRTQVVRRFKSFLAPNEASIWMPLNRDHRDSTPQCIERLEIIGRALGGPSRLRVEWR